MAISAEKIYGLIKEEKINYIVALEQCYVGVLSLIEDKLMELGIDQIITVSASDSMDNKAKWNYLKENLYFGGWKQLRRQLDRQNILKNYLSKQYHAQN